MAKVAIHSVDDYIDAQPASTRTVLIRVRAAIRRALPDAVEGVSYALPVFRLNDKAVLYMAGWKKHFSLYPASGALEVALHDDLAHFELSKGTVRFPLDEPVPVKLIERIAKFRAKEVAAKG